MRKPPKIREARFHFEWLLRDEGISK